MQSALCIETDICGPGNGRGWEIRNAQDRCPQFLGVLKRGLDFPRHLQEVDGDQGIATLHKRELLQERRTAGEKYPVSILFYAHKPKVKQISERHRGIETYEKYFARAPDNLDRLVKIRKPRRLKCFLQELDVPLDELGKYVFVIAQLGEGLFHAVRGAQLAAHLLLDFPLEFGEAFVAQALSEAHDGRLADPDGVSELAHIGKDQGGAVILQVMTEPFLRPVEGVSLG